MSTRPRSLTHLTEPPWMSVISLLCPNFFPVGMEYADWELLYHVKLLVGQPSINWSLVYKVCNAFYYFLYKINVFFFVKHNVSDFDDA